MSNIASIRRQGGNSSPKHMAKKGLLLIAGLDSTLAGLILAEQRVPLDFIHFHTPFCTCRGKVSECKIVSNLKELVAEFFKSSPIIFNAGGDYLPIIKHPQFGYGKNLNPCIDCKIFMFRKAKEYMLKNGLSFLVTGEVLGERPMSQNKRALELIEKNAGLAGLVLRPLSAKLMPETAPEKEGWVNRESLFGIQGRSRKGQLALAAKYNLYDYPTPSGGCLLTDPGFSRRLKDLMLKKEDFTLRDIKLLKLGRHFRVSRDLKLIVGRDKQDNERIEEIFNPEVEALLMPLNSKGPVALAMGERSDIINNQLYLSRIVASHCKSSFKGDIEIKICSNSKEQVFKIEPQKAN